MPKYLNQYPDTVIPNSKEYKIHWKINFTKLTATVGRKWWRTCGFTLEMRLMKTRFHIRDYPSSSSQQKEPRQMVNVENVLNNTVNETHIYLIQPFYSQLLGHNNQPVNGDKRGENTNPRAPLNLAFRILVSY